MHIPDGFINAGTSLGAGAAATAGLSMAIHRAGRVLDDRRVPLAGLVAAFVFAAQMLNFPVAGGTSGHLLGGALAAVLMGPWIGALCVSVVVIVQVFFADGGLTALGLNVLNIALIPSLFGYIVFKGLCGVFRNARSQIVFAAGAAAGISVLLSAGAFVAEFSLGGSSAISIGGVATAMLSVHSLIAIGEGVITAATVGFALNVRPDLVYAAEDLVVQAPPGARDLAREGAA